MKKNVLFALVLTLGLVGCGSGSTSNDELLEEDMLSAELEEPEELTIEDILASPPPEAIEPETLPYADAPLATIYISTNSENYTEYPINYSGDLSAEFLISEMAFITGWNLDLADEVTSGAGGMTVAFADTSALVVGPPDEQLDQFFCYDTYQLAESILDSVQHTLQYNFVDAELGDPTTLDIYFCGENDAELYIPQIDVTVSMYEPYSGSLMG